VSDPTGDEKAEIESGILQKYKGKIIGYGEQRMCFALQILF